MTIPAYLDRLVSLGITAVEVQLPPMLAADEIERWSTLVYEARKRQLKLAIHAPMAPDNALWSQVLAWIAGLATAPITVIVHGCRASQPIQELAAGTVAHVHSLLAAAPLATVAVEQSWNWGVQIGLGGSLRRIRDQLQRQRGNNQRPSGVGSGMGSASSVPTRSPPPAETIYDPPLDANWWQSLRRADGFSATGTREETFQVVMEVNQPNCVIAWDLAHDWLGGTKGGAAGWRSIPSADFLDRVGYVRLHDVDKSGRDHWPLVIGNVPYASQLRTLLTHGFTGTVCLAIRYTSQMRTFGDRWHVLDRSLATARQALRLN